MPVRNDVVVMHGSSLLAVTGYWRPTADYPVLPDVQAVRCSAELLVSGSQQASSALHALQQNPLLQDACATVVAAAGAVALVKIFRALSSRGIVDQVGSIKLVECCAVDMHHRLWSNSWMVANVPRAQR